MRAQLKQQEGAVAILVAILVVVLVGIASFVTDFGLAYANKRNLQKAADAASLAAAGAVIRSLTSPTENCASVAARYAADTGSFATTLRATADTIAVANNPRSTRTGMTVACSADSKRIEVGYSNTGTTPTIFGGVYGQSAIQVSRSATADVFVRESGVGLRPYAVCIDNAIDLKGRVGTAQPWVGIEYPSTSCPGYPGNWTVLRCPGQWSPSSSDLAVATLDGCATEVGVIPHFDGSTTPPSELDIPNASVTAAIRTQCEATAAKDLLVPADCMQATTGASMNNLGTEWLALMGKPNIALPAFKSNWNTWADVTPGVSGCSDSGSNVCYPVAALVSVKVCGFMFGNTDITSFGGATVDPRGGNPSWAYDPSNSLCTGVRADLIANPATGSNRKLWLAMTPGGFQTSGTTGPGSIGVGGGFGLLGTRLVR